MKQEKIVIGQSDYTRGQIESGNNGWTIGSSWDFLKTIIEFERQGYIVKFKNSILRRIFGLGKYKVIAIKK